MGDGVAVEGPQVLLVVSGNTIFLAQVQKEFGCRAKPVSVVIANGIQGARQALESRAAAAILFDETVLGNDSKEQNGRNPTLWAAITSLAEHAPVVVMGCAEHQSELKDLLASGVADYVTPSEFSLRVAVGMVERRFRQRLLRTTAAADSKKRGKNLHGIPNLFVDNLDFAGVLRHELNNPLTGILGNAELLLVELRRNNSKLPANVSARLETIAALAVRMRETVRRLSEEWETKAEKGSRLLARG